MNSEKHQNSNRWQKPVIPVETGIQNLKTSDPSLVTRYSSLYVGIPFKCDGETRETGVDCWKLVCLIYRERLGITLPTFTGVFLDHSQETLREVSQVMKEEKEKWIKVEKPAVYDVVLLRTGILAYHVGLVLDSRRMIHIMDGIDSCIEEYTGLQWKNRIEGFYRYQVKVNGE